MKALLDTHTFVWMDGQPSRLSPAAVAFLQDPAHTLLLSVVSVWEILTKIQLRKMSLHMPLGQIISHQRNNGVQVLVLELDHVFGLEKLPSIHKDPFDRLLIAQANAEGAVLISADAVVTQYPVKVLW